MAIQVFILLRIDHVGGPLEEDLLYDAFTIKLDASSFLLCNNFSNDGNYKLLAREYNHSWKSRNAVKIREYIFKDEIWNRVLLWKKYLYYYPCCKYNTLKLTDF